MLINTSRYVLLMMLLAMQCIDQIALAKDYPVYIEGGIEIINFDYREFSTAGSLLDKEVGNIPGINFNAEMNNNYNTYGVKAAFLSGTVTYDGMTQSGTPHTTDTNERISNLSFFLKRRIPSVREEFNLLYGLGYRRWERDIQSTASVNGLYEVYKWPYWQLGAEIGLVKRNNYSIALLGHAGRAINPTLDVHFPGYDKAVIRMPIGINFYLGVPINITSNKDYQFVIQPYYEYWGFDRSESQALLQNGVTTRLSITEPENETEIVGVKVNMKFRP